jgi:transcriptional regulator of heat shock response
MLPIDPRKGKVLSAIIQQFINTAEPVGSKTVLINYNMSVSPATIRNDMAFLENEGLIYQPHTSAGRVPTTAGYRMYIEKLADYKRAEKLAQKNLSRLMENVAQRRAQQRVHDAVSLLAQATPNVAFASIPGNKRTFFLGVSQLLKQPEFAEHPLQASQVFEVLEQGTQFLATLKELEVVEDPRIFIGKENLLPQIESCSLIVAHYKVEDFEGYLGLLGPTRMPYAFNLATLKEVKKLLTDPS